MIDKAANSPATAGVANLNAVFTMISRVSRPAVPLVTGNPRVFRPEDTTLQPSRAFGNRLSVFGSRA
jgi:hypothetical protein